MSTTIKEDFLEGGAGSTPKGAGDPTTTKALREAADDLAALAARSVAMQATLDLVVTQQTAIRTKVDSSIGAHTGHLAAGGVHVDADTANVITSPVATDPLADGISFVNHAVTKFMTHRVNVTGSIHGSALDPNEVTAPLATDKATAIARGADLYDQYEAHRVYTTDSVHGAADNTNTIGATKPTDWDELILFLIEFKDDTAFNQHIALTAGGVHGADGSADAITADDPGVQITALYLEVNEGQTDLNAHIAHTGVHPLAGTADSTAAATTEVTTVALVNSLKGTINTHGTSATDHLDADTTAVAATATGYEDCLPAVAEFRAAFVTHKAKYAVHSKADPGNAETVIGAGGDVTALGTGGAVTIGLLKG